MPELGERVTKNGITGEWNGTTWRRVETAPSDARPAPKVGERLTKDGVTGEWDGTTWRRIAAPGADPTPDTDERPANLMGGVSALAATGAAAVPAAKGLADYLSRAPARVRALGLPAAAGRVAGPLNVAKQLYDVANGKQSIAGAATDAAIGEVARRVIRPEQLIMRGAQAVQRAVTPIASALGTEGVAGMSAPVAVPIAGGLAGVAGTAGFLGALQHDANRKVDIDYSKNTPDTDIAKVLMNMRNSEANRGRSLDERMDDPNDVMFRPDDAAMVRAAVLSQMGR